jgi:hypothetical protein
MPKVSELIEALRKTQGNAQVFLTNYQFEHSEGGQRNGGRVVILEEVLNDIGSDPE